MHAPGHVAVLGPASIDFVFGEIERALRERGCGVTRHADGEALLADTPALTQGRHYMKKMFGAAIIACALTTGVAAAQSAPPSPQRQIQPLLDELMLAANAHDTDRFLAPYLHDSTLVFVFNGRVVNGFTTLRELQFKAWNSPKTDAVYTLRGPDTYTVLAPGLVLATSLLASRRTQPTGEITTNEMVITMVWQMRPEGWRIVHAHESTLPPRP